MKYKRRESRGIQQTLRGGDSDGWPSFHGRGLRDADTGMEILEKVRIGKNQGRDQESI